MFQGRFTGFQKSFEMFRCRIFQRVSEGFRGRFRGLWRCREFNRLSTQQVSIAFLGDYKRVHSFSGSFRGHHRLLSELHGDFRRVLETFRALLGHRRSFKRLHSFSSQLQLVSEAFPHKLSDELGKNDVAWLFRVYQWI